MQCSLIQGLYMSQVANQAGAYPRFCSMKQLEVFVPHPPFLGGMLVHCINSSVPICVVWVSIIVMLTCTASYIMGMSPPSLLNLNDDSRACLVYLKTKPSQNLTLSMYSKMCWLVWRNPETQLSTISVTIVHVHELCTSVSLNTYVHKTDAEVQECYLRFSVKKITSVTVFPPYIN